MYVEEFLSHHGVKGMKWGVRRDHNTSGDFVVGKQNPIYNISADKPRDINGQVYAAFTKKDIANYRGMYTLQLKVFNQVPHVFSNAFELKGDLKVAGEKAQLDTFKNLWDKDKPGMAKALAASQVDISITAAIVNRVLHIDRTKAYEKRFMDASVDYMMNKGFKQFQSALGAPGNNLKTPYYKSLAKRGYSALLDLNDLTAYNSEKPVLIFKGKDVLKNQKSLELTESDYKLALSAYKDADKLNRYDVNKLHAKHMDAIGDFLEHYLSEEVDRMNDVDNFLAHFGVKGMKWGVHRKNRLPASKDAQVSLDIRAKAKSNKVKSLSNAELQAAINRMGLEQQFKRLSVNERPPVQRWIASTLLEVGKREVQTAIAKKVAGTVAKKVATGGLA